jgi:hypothetical protein
MLSQIDPLAEGDTAALPERSQVVNLFTSAFSNWLRAAEHKTLNVQVDVGVQD